MSWFSREKPDMELKLVHDLGNSLACIKGYVQLLLNSKRPDFMSEKEALKTIDFCSNQALGLMQDLMDQAAIEHGDFTLRRKPVVLEDLLKQISGGFDVICKSKKVALRQYFPTSGTVISADAKRIGQVVSNLLSNAVRHTPEGGAISISLSLQEGEVGIFIQDNGDGIALPEQAKIFQKSYRSGPNSGSLGLGLSICRDIVALHGGDIGVISEGKGKGACFHFTLPLKGVRPAIAAKRSSPWVRAVGYTAAALAMILGFAVIKQQWTSMPSGLEDSSAVFHATVDSLTSTPQNPRSLPAKSNKDFQSQGPHADALSSFAADSRPGAAGSAQSRTISMTHSGPEHPEKNTFRHNAAQRMTDALASISSQLEVQAARAGIPFDGGKTAGPAVAVSFGASRPAQEINAADLAGAPRQTNLQSSSSPRTFGTPATEATPLTQASARMNASSEGAGRKSAAATIARDRLHDPLVWYAGGVTGLLLLTLPFALFRKSSREDKEILS